MKKNPTQPKRTKNPCPPRVVLQLVNICNEKKFPIFFVNDFIEYQNDKNWILNGKKIKRPTGVFVRYATARKERLVNAGKWRGDKIENWDLTAAVFRGFKEPSNPQISLYIEHLAILVYENKPMTQQEREHAEQMGMFKELEDLRKENNSMGE